MTKARTLPAGFERPFRWDGMAYFWDAKNQMAADFDGGLIRARGWGRVQYREDGEEDMDMWAAWVADIVGTETDPEKIVELLNKEQHVCPACDSQRPHRVFLMERQGAEWHLAPLGDPKTYCGRDREDLIHMPKGAMSGLTPCVPCLEGLNNKEVGAEDGKD